MFQKCTETNRTRKLDVTFVLDVCLMSLTLALARYVLCVPVCVCVFAARSWRREDMCLSLSWAGALRFCKLHLGADSKQDCHEVCSLMRYCGCTNSQPINTNRCPTLVLTVNAIQLRQK
eukprot:6371877-Amphidinium_carterae.1